MSIYWVVLLTKIQHSSINVYKSSIGLLIYSGCNQHPWNWDISFIDNAAFLQTAYYNFQRIYRYIFNTCTNIYGENCDYTYCKGDLTIWNIMIWVIGRIITHFDKGRCPLLWYWELNKQSCLQCDNMQGQTTCLDWSINKSYWCIGICFCMWTLN